MKTGQIGSAMSSHSGQLNFTLYSRYLFVVVKSLNIHWQVDKMNNFREGLGKLIT